MLVKDVLTKYHGKIPFPWTLRKIKKAGFEPAALFLELGRELERCEDVDSETGKSTIDLIQKLKLL